VQIAVASLTPIAVVLALLVNLLVKVAIKRVKLTVSNVVPQFVLIGIKVIIKYLFDDLSLNC
jgi:hypothetical protein